jgi:hypothetical protein
VLFSPAHELSATAEAMPPNMAAMQSARAGFAGLAAASTNARALATTGRLRGPGQAALISTNQTDRFAALSGSYASFTPPDALESLVGSRLHNGSPRKL